MINGMNSNIKNKRNIRAACYMLLSVMFFALVPSLIIYGEGDKAPFMYNAVRALFACIGIFIFLAIFYHRQLFDREIWQAVIRNWRSWSLLGIFVGFFDYAVFSWSLKYIDVSVASVLYETWPLWMILLISAIFKKDNRYENIGSSVWVFLLMGFIGLVFVILSQNDDLTTLTDIPSLFSLLFGAFLALTASIMAAMVGGCSIRWGATVMYDIPDYKHEETDKDLTAFFVLIAILLSNIPGIIIGITMGVWGGHNEIVEANNMIIAAILGFFILTTGIISFRMANLITTKLEINAMSYATPIFALVYLAILGYINVPHVDWLIIGTIGVVAANILLNFKAAIKTTHQYWVLAVWIVGIMVYFI